MFFNSLHFAIFLPIVFILYWFVGHKSKTKSELYFDFSELLFLFLLGLEIPILIGFFDLA